VTIENFVDWPYLHDVCNEAFSKQSHLIRHQHINNGEQPYEFIYWVVKEFELSLRKLFTKTRTHNDACRE